MAQLWRYTSDIFDRELGQSHRLAVSVRLDYIKRVISDPRDEERTLRDLVAQFKDTPAQRPRVMLNLAQNLSKQEHYDEAQELAQNVARLLQKFEIFARRVVEKIESPDSHRLKTTSPNPISVFGPEHPAL
jgi:hypothetical protein